MKIFFLALLALFFLYHLTKAVVQLWPRGWPFPKEKEVKEASRHVLLLNLRRRFAKEAARSLIICLVMAIIIQFLLQTGF